MYACFLATGHGLFEGVCAPSNAPSISATHPPPNPRFANWLWEMLLPHLEQRFVSS
jgi:hypothetical protein